MYDFNGVYKELLTLEKEQRILLECLEDIAGECPDGIDNCKDVNCKCYNIKERISEISKCLKILHKKLEDNIF